MIKTREKESRVRKIGVIIHWYFKRCHITSTHTNTDTHMHTELGWVNRQMAKAGDVGGDAGGCNWLQRFVISLSKNLIGALLKQWRRLAWNHMLIDVIGRQLETGQWSFSNRPHQLLSDIKPIGLSTPRSASIRRHGNQEGGGARRGEGRTVANSHRFSPLYLFLTITHESHTDIHHYQRLTAAWWQCNFSVTLTTTLSLLYAHIQTFLYRTHTHTHTKMSQRFLSQLASSVLRVFGCSHDTVSVWMEDLRLNLVWICKHKMCVREREIENPVLLLFICYLLFILIHYF